MIDSEFQKTLSEQPDEEWWRGAVIYQIYPRSFMDTTGDGVGDLNGITQKLDYIASLGVDAVWISPFFTSPMKDYGYDVADYCDVDPVFGSLADFDKLIETAHRLKLKVILDQVYSHTSDEHAWFSESRSSRSNAKSDWYVWGDAKPDGSPPNNWQSVFGGPAWEWDARRQQYYMHNFLREQPQLNLHNQEVQSALLDAGKFWLDRGVDGFRLDAINFSMHDKAFKDNPPSGAPLQQVTRPFDMQLHLYNQSQPEIPLFLERVRALMNQYGATFSVAEVGGPNPIGEMKAFTAGDKRLQSAYNFDFLYADDLTPTRIKGSLEQWTGETGEGWPSWAFSNHDAPRAISRWAKGADEAQVARTCMMLLLSMRGNSFIYQGEELGLPQADVPFDRLLDPEAIANWPLTLGRDGARTPMPWSSEHAQLGFSTASDTWLPVDPRHAPLAVSEQDGATGSCLNATRSLLSLRRKKSPLVIGDIAILNYDDDVLVFLRTYETEKVLCAFNLGSTEKTLEAAGDWTVIATEDGALDYDVAIPVVLRPWSGVWARPRC